MRDQLGFTVTGITPVGLESSAGATPLRLRVEGAPQEYLFAKLYTKGHVRADRWYKIWRTILYGSLEDEHPFQTVRRLAEYEDYALRLLQDAGVTVPRPYGIVEITPEREYLLVTEYFDGAVEIGGADIDDQVIDQGLLLIRTLWDAGIAHRDIKPGNLMVRAGQLLLIDVAFAQVRPSPWRQAVDLGNMMLVLAVRTDPARVYQRALTYFTEAELAEAFAATRGVASPTQLRAFMKRDPPGPARRVPHARPAAKADRAATLERPGGLAWPRRCLPSSACPPFSALACCCPAAAFTGHAPDCGTGHTMILAAQAIPLGRLPALHRRGPAGLDRGRHPDRQRAGDLPAGLRPDLQRAVDLAAGLRPGRAADGDDHPDRDLRHGRHPADFFPASQAGASSSVGRAWYLGTPTFATTFSLAAA